MDYEPANQSVNPPANPPMSSPMEPMDQDSSMNVWYIAGAVVVIAVLGLWYYSTLTPAADMPSQTIGTPASVTDPAQTAALSSGNSVEDISADLTQTSDGSAELNQAAAASVQAIQGF